MPKFSRSHVERALFVAAVIAFLVHPAANLYAQQDEIPPATVEQSDGGPVAAEQGSDRIVDGRPNLYSVKRALHPIAWVEGGVIRPLLGLAQKGGFERVGSRDADKAPRVSGVKFAIKGMGSGSGFGPEIKPFHTNLFNSGIEFEAPMLFTYRFYHSGQAIINFPLFSGTGLDRVGLELNGRYASRASDNFFGVGNDSSLTNEARFRSITRGGGAALVIRTESAWSARFEAGYRSVGITRPRRTPSALGIFERVDVPALTTDRHVTMASATGVLQRDSRDNPDLTESGGLQRVEVSLNEGLTGGDFSYWRYTAELRQFIPLSSDRRKVLSFRGQIDTTQEKGGSSIPFFDLPTIGSHSTVRGFDGRRFTDRSAMSASVDYRYRIWRHFDVGLFADAGQVAPEVRNFAMDRFHASYGARFIMRTQKHRGFAIEAAHSKEWPLMFYLDFSPLF